MTSSVGVLGASSFVGGSLLTQLASSGTSVFAFSRCPSDQTSPDIKWISTSGVDGAVDPDFASLDIQLWVSLLPIWLLPNFFSMLLQAKVKRLVILSSTSRFTKVNSSYEEDRILVDRLISSESEILDWSEKHGIEITILYPTMIYNCVNDENISAIAKLIKRFGFFPILGKGSGLRQPVHAVDVAFACKKALTEPLTKSHYFLSGGETVTYREMVERIFMGLDRPSRIISVPPAMFRCGVFCARTLGLKASLGMIARMEEDLVFDHTSALADLAFNPRSFEYKMD